jgi:small subunit ribosomal protein S17
MTMAETDTMTRTQRKTRTGVVTSDKMMKTVTVELTRRFAHPVYGKQMTRSTTVKARDEHGAKVGDTVRRVTEIVKRAK